MATFTQGFHSSKLEEQPEVTLSHGPTDSPIRKRVLYDSSLVPNVTGFSQAVIPSGSSVERHVHASKYETFFCLNGQGKLIVGQNEGPCGEDHELALEKGCCITVAPRFWHSVHNTGLIVFHARHKNAKGPLHMVHSENWLVYCLFNTKSRRYELTVLEMYDGYTERNSTVLSSFDPPPMPMILQQSYIFPTTIRTATVTITERGITHKNLLFGLQTGYILSLPKNFLDPRRKFVPNAQDREEGLHPYVPELSLNPLEFINYNQTISNINGIYTAGSGLESTCLVFAYGLDLFWTRVTPSRMFDVLKEDFDYWFIVGTLGILVLVSIVSQRLASIKMLRQAWQ